MDYIDQMPFGYPARPKQKAGCFRLESGKFNWIGDLIKMGTSYKRRESEALNLVLATIRKIIPRDEVSRKLQFYIRLLR